MAEIELNLTDQAGVNEAVGTAPPVYEVPTVGRIVHFYDRHLADRTQGFGINGQGEGPYAATVVQVSGEYVNLTVFRPFAEPVSEGSVSHKGTPMAENRWWVWPPRV